MKKYILPITIGACSILIAVSGITAQVIKSRSFERKQELEHQYKMQELNKEYYQENQRLIRYDQCESEAEDKYFDYAELNGTINDEGIINASQRVWDYADKMKARDIEICKSKFLN